MQGRGQMKRRKNICSTALVNFHIPARRERERGDIDRVFINKRSRTLSRRRGDRRINGDKMSMTEFQNEL